MRDRKEAMLSHEELRKRPRYEPQCDAFYWRSGIRASQRAGYTNGAGYICIRIDGREYKAQRLAFFYAHARWPGMSDLLSTGQEIVGACAVHLRGHEFYRVSGRAEVRRVKLH
jgi:hypothetical protein